MQPTEIAHYRLIEAAYFSFVTVVKRNGAVVQPARELSDAYLEADDEILWPDLPEYYMEPISQAAREICDLNPDRMRKLDLITRLTKARAAIISASADQAESTAPPQLDVVPPRSAAGRALANASTFLASLLSRDDDGVPVSEIREAGEGQGHSWRSLQRAKEALGVKARKRGRGGWIWCMPKNATGVSAITY